MNKDDVLKALQAIKAHSPKRKFKQTCDLIINLRGLNLKKNDHQVDIYVQLHYPRGKEIKTCAFVDTELKDAAIKACTTVVRVEEFDKYAKNPKLAKKLAQEHDFFIAQANVMPKVAGAFGKVLGPRNKMPNPKAGCVIPPNANIDALVEKLQKTVRVMVKTGLLFQTRVGKEDTKDEEIIDNVVTIYNALLHALPGEENNLKNSYLKLTMGPPVKIGEEYKPKEPAKKEPKKKAEKKEGPKVEEKPAEEPKKEEPKAAEPPKEEPAKKEEAKE